VGDILGKVKDKFREFFHQSKKLVQPPKELPSITTQNPAKPPMTKTLNPPEPPKEQIMIRTDLPQQQSQAKNLNLPKIVLPRALETIHEQKKQLTNFHDDDLRQFEDAISNIKIDVINNETPASLREDRNEAEALYRPKELGEGYFAEIQHYLKNKDVKEIIDDILTKDFLTNMKDYHDTKAQGKPFYLHGQDLKQKLEEKMTRLRELEEDWHELRTQAEEKEQKKHLMEKQIDEESQDLKDLFKQIKVNQWMEKEAQKEHYFKLRNSQELKSLNDLRKALTYMADDEFNHHVNAERNDFAKWTKEALQNQEIAEKIGTAKTKEELQEILKKPF